MFTMRALRSCVAPVSFALALTLVPFAVPAVSAAPSKRLRGANSRASADAIDAFKHAVDGYRKLREREEAKVGALPKTADPAAITKRQHALGEAIRGARAGAQQGEIFAPAVAVVLKRVIEEDLRNRRPVDRQAFIVSQPDTTVRVNDFYPTTVPLATVPPRLLAALPQLPDGLEYRFVNGALILRDVDPNLVVDVLPDVVPSPHREQK